MKEYLHRKQPSCLRKHYQAPKASLSIAAEKIITAKKIILRIHNFLKVPQDWVLPPSIMSMLPKAPNLRTIKSNSMKKKKSMTRGKNKTKGPMSTDTFLDQMDDYVEINPKYGSPFSQKK